MAGEDQPCGGPTESQSGQSRWPGWHVIVLAAGRGRRMGGPKALMMVGGRPWWQIQEERLAATGMRRTWVVSNQVEGAMTACGSELVIADGEAPMFESVRTGIAAVPPGSGVLVLPVDVPAPSAAVVEALVRASASRPAVPVHRGKRGHPVALPREWIARVFAPACLRAGDLRLDELIAPELVEIHVEDPAVVVNLNTPEDVARWNQLAAAKRG